MRPRELGGACKPACASAAPQVSLPEQTVPVRRLWNTARPVDVPRSKKREKSGSLFFHQVGQILVLGTLGNSIGMLMARSLNLEGFQGLVFKKNFEQIEKFEVFLDFSKVEKRKSVTKVVKFRFLELKISEKSSANLKLEIPL